jgi:hypothetical protein
MELIRSDVEDGPVKPVSKLYVGPSLEEKFMRGKPQQMNSKEAGMVLSFIKRALRYEPSARPTTTELLADPWIRSIDDF